MANCSECRDAGEVQCPSCAESGVHSIPCRACGGSAPRSGEDCARCGGEGHEEVPCTDCRGHGVTSCRMCL